MSLTTLTDNLADRGYSILPEGLDVSACSSLLADAQQLDENDSLRSAGIGRSGVEHSAIRGDRIRWLEQGLSASTNHFLGMTEQLRQRLNHDLYLGLNEYEGHIACYGPGAGYQKHLDRIKGSDARVLTLIAYLNPAWRDEDGGQLRLYLNDGTVVEVLPQACTIVAFLSGDYWHEVLPGKRDRWAITGWFRR